AVAGRPDGTASGHEGDELAGGAPLGDLHLHAVRAPVLPDAEGADRAGIRDVPDLRRAPEAGEHELERARLAPRRVEPEVAVLSRQRLRIEGLDVVDPALPVCVAAGHGEGE